MNPIVILMVIAIVAISVFVLIINFVYNPFNSTSTTNSGQFSNFPTGKTTTTSSPITTTTIISTTTTSSNQTNQTTTTTTTTNQTTTTTTTAPSGCIGACTSGGFTNGTCVSLSTIMSLSENYGKGWDSWTCATGQTHKTAGDAYCPLNYVGGWSHDFCCCQ